MVKVSEQALTVLLTDRLEVAATCIEGRQTTPAHGLVKGAHLSTRVLINEISGGVMCTARPR